MQGKAIYSKAYRVMAISHCCWDRADVAMFGTIFIGGRLAAMALLRDWCPRDGAFDLGGSSILQGVAVYPIDRLD